MEKRKNNKKNKKVVVPSSVFGKIFYNVKNLHHNICSRCNCFIESNFISYIRNYITTNIFALSVVKQTSLTFFVWFVLSVFIPVLREETLRFIQMPLGMIISGCGLILAVSSIAGMFVESPFILFCANFFFGFFILLFGIIYSVWGLPYCLIYISIVLCMFGDAIFEFKSMMTKFVIAFIIFVIGFNTRNLAHPYMDLLKKNDVEIYGECKEATWKIKYDFVNIKSGGYGIYDTEVQHVFRVYKGLYTDAKIAAKQEEEYLNMLNKNEMCKDSNLKKEFKVSYVTLYEVPESIALKIGDTRFNKGESKYDILCSPEKFEEIYLRK